MTLSNTIALDKELENVQKKTEALIFISESFRASCQGNGFSSFEEWKQVCGSMWQLENIEWKSESLQGNKIYYGKWKGPYGAGEVYVNEGE